jgi:hypothetical protein
MAAGNRRPSDHRNLNGASGDGNPTQWTNESSRRAIPRGFEDDQDDGFRPAARADFVFRPHGFAQNGERPRTRGDLRCDVPIRLGVKPGFFAKSLLTQPLQHIPVSGNPLGFFRHAGVLFGTSSREGMPTRAMGMAHHGTRSRCFDSSGKKPLTACAALSGEDRWVKPIGS